MKYNSKAFSNTKLEKLSKYLKRFERGYAPWLNYSSEIYSFGKTFRIFSNFSKYLPICVHSDHGVSVAANYIDYEKTTNFPFLTWNYRKFLKIKKTGREVYYIQNPWIYYRKKYYKNNNLHKKKGTIVFFPKSIPGVNVKIKNLNKYIHSLKKLPKKCHPISICLSFYDIQQHNLHKKLRKYNLNLVTVGNSSSQNFIDRFYKLISQFRYASAPIGARPFSGFFYCIEYGLPFFFYGKNIQYISDGSRSKLEGWKKGKLRYSQIFLQKNSSKLEKYYLNKLIKNFLNIKDNVNKYQKELISPYLGLNSKITRNNLKFIFIKSLISNIWIVVRLYYNSILKRKIKL